MKKILMLLYIILGTAYLKADEFVLNLDNIQNIYKLQCIDGIYNVLVEIDDVTEPVPVYKMENGKEVYVPCETKNVSNSKKDRSK